MDYGQVLFSLASPIALLAMARALYIAPRNRAREAKRIFERAFLFLAGVYVCASCTRLMQCYLGQGIGA